MRSTLSLVRVNLLPPRVLADQHLVAEYREIFMLLGHVRKYPAVNNVPEAKWLATDTKGQRHHQAASPAEVQIKTAFEKLLRNG